MPYERTSRILDRLTPEQRIEFDKLYDREREIVMRDIQETRRDQNLEDRQRYNDWLADPETYARDIRHYRPTAGLDTGECGTGYDVDRKFALDRQKSLLLTVDQPERQTMSAMVECLSYVYKEVNELNIETMILMNIGGKYERTPIGRAAEAETDRLTGIIDQKGTAFNGVNNLLEVAHGTTNGIPFVEHEWYSDPARTDEEKKNCSTFGLQTETMTKQALAVYGLTFQQCIELVSVQKGLPSVKIDMENNPDINMLKFGDKLNEKNYKSLSITEREYGTQTYDRAFSNMYTPEQKQRLAEDGLSEFDMVQINGKSAAELFGDKYKDATPLIREQLIKCEITKAALNPKNNIECVRLEPDGKLSEPVHAEIECGLTQRYTKWQKFKGIFGFKTPTLQSQLDEQNVRAVMRTPEETQAIQAAARARIEHVAAQRVVAQNDTKYNQTANEDVFFSGIEGRNEQKNKNDLFGAIDRSNRGLATLDRPTSRVTLAALYAITYSDMTPEQAFDSTYVGNKPQLGNQLYDKLKNGTTEELAKMFQDMGDKLESLPVPEMDPSKPLDMVKNYRQYDMLQHMYIDFDQIQRGKEIREARAALPGYDAAKIQRQATVLDNMGSACKSGMDLVEAVAEDAYVDESKMNSNYAERALKARQVCEYITEEMNTRDFRTLDQTRFSDQHVAMCQALADNAIVEELDNWIVSQSDQISQYIHTGENPLVYIARDQSQPMPMVVTGTENIAQEVARARDRQNQAMEVHADEPVSDMEDDFEIIDVEEMEAQEAQTIIDIDELEALDDVQERSTAQRKPVSLDDLVKEERPQVKPQIKPQVKTEAVKTEPTADKGMKVK